MVRLPTILVLGLVFQLAIAQPEWRTLDGRNNNKQHPLWGSTYSQLTRDNIEWYYEDGISKPMTTGYPSPREVSNRLFSMMPENPLAAQGFSDMHTYWGQFLDHDITWSPELDNDFLYIPIPEQNDVFFNPFNQQNLTMKFKRSQYDPTTGITTPRAQVNVLTSFIDGSMVYGVNTERANALRDLDSKGKLKTTTINGHVYPPKNTYKLPNANNNRFVPAEEQFLCGDLRCNENPMLTALHTVFVREHNRLADKFAKDHPEWDGERIYQEARRWVGAFCQAITFNEYSLATTGRALPEYTGYNPNVNPSIMGAFSSVAFRYGHSEVNVLIPRLDENRRPIPQGHLLFRDGYFNPPVWEREGIEAMIIGSAWQHQQEVDLFYVDDIRNFLFGLPGQGGLDLAALSIERGRDHGMPPYNALRAAYGLPPRTFDQISSKPEINAIFKDVYKNNIDLVDSFVAGLAEDKPTGAHVGEMFREIIWEQYRRLRDGDRFYYRAPDAGFTAAEIAEIDGTRLSHIILRNTNIKALQCGVLFVSNALDCGEVTTAPTAGGASSVDLLGGNYNLAWQINGDKITITMRANTNGWVGFGIPEAPARMVGADVILGWVDDNTNEVVVNDFFITDRAAGCPNGVCEDTNRGGNRDITDVSGTQENGVTTIKFTRPLAASDADWDRAIAVGSDQQIIFAFGNTDSLTYHGANRGGSAVNFASGGVTAGRDFKTIEKRIAHGTIMIFSWMVLLPLGIYFASFFKHLTSWFRVHIALQTIGVMFAIAGMIIAIEFTAELNSPHFDGVHQAFGLTTQLIMICAPYLGYLSDMMFVPGRKATPIFPDKVHWTFGYVSTLLSFPTIYLGLYAFGAPTEAYVLVGIWNACMFVAYIVLSVFKAKGKIGQHFPIEGHTDHELSGSTTAYMKLNEEH